MTITTPSIEPATYVSIPLLDQQAVNTSNVVSKIEGGQFFKFGRLDRIFGKSITEKFDLPIYNLFYFYTRYGTSSRLIDFNSTIEITPVIGNNTVTIWENPVIPGNPPLLPEPPFPDISLFPDINISENNFSIPAPAVGPPNIDGYWQYYEELITAGFTPTDATNSTVMQYYGSKKYNVDFVLESWIGNALYSNGQSGTFQYPGIVNFNYKDGPLKTSYAHSGVTNGLIVAVEGFKIGLTPPKPKGWYCVWNGGFYSSESVAGISKGTEAAPHCYINLPEYYGYPKYGTGIDAPPVRNITLNIFSPGYVPPL